MPDSGYKADVQFLKAHADIVQLTGPDGARAAVAPGYQGRVMTSTLGDGRDRGFGWINRPFIEAGRQDETFNNYGGEDRFWLGPEAGQFGLWFRKGQPFDLAHWKTPAGLNRGPFKVAEAGRSGITMTRQMELANYSGTTFRCSVRRTIRMLTGVEAAACMGVEPPAGVSMAAFESANTLTNAGQNPWTPDAGLLSLWILGMFKPLPRGQVIVPFCFGDPATLGPAATTDYFGPVPPSRCTVTDDHVLFACDGRFRGKIGISRPRAKDVLGSFDPDGGVLTVVQFNKPRVAARLPYVNSLWKIQKDPFAGDVVNSYNDGEAAPGAGQLGPFYELETSSPAADLAPQASLTHIHRTCHYAGAFDELNFLAKRILGIDLTTGRKIPSTKPKIAPTFVG